MLDSSPVSSLVTRLTALPAFILSIMTPAWEDRDGFALSSSSAWSSSYSASVYACTGAQLMASARASAFAVPGSASMRRTSSCCVLYASGTSASSDLEPGPGASSEQSVMAAYAGSSCPNRADGWMWTPPGNIALFFSRASKTLMSIRTSTSTLRERPSVRARLTGSSSVPSAGVSPA